MSESCNPAPLDRLPVDRPGVVAGAPSGTEHPIWYVWLECRACFAEIGIKGSDYWWPSRELLQQDGLVSCPECGAIHQIDYDADWTSLHGWEDLTSLRLVRVAA